MQHKYSWECLTKKPPRCVSNGKLKKILFNGRDFAKKKFALISQWFSSIFEIRKSFLYNGYFVMPKDGSKIALWLIHKAFKHFYFLQMSGVWIIQISIKKKKKRQQASTLCFQMGCFGERLCLSPASVATCGTQSLVAALSGVCSIPGAKGLLTNLSLQIFTSNRAFQRTKVLWLW